MQKFLKDLTKEVNDFFELILTCWIVLIVIGAIGQATGMYSLLEPLVAIIFLALGIGVPIGIFSAIMFLQRTSNNTYYSITA